MFNKEFEAIEEIKKILSKFTRYEQKRIVRHLYIQDINEATGVNEKIQ